MIITTERQIALRCPICGCLELHNLSLFAFSGKQSLTVKCVCGFKLFSLSTKDHRNYFLQYTCMICDEVHMLKLRYAQIWKNDLTPILCPATGQEMGYIGSRERLDEFVLENCQSMESIMNDIGFSDFFASPTIMVQVLAHLHRIAEEGNLYCLCGNSDIQVEVFPDKLELHCPRCNSLSIIYAESQEDLDLLRSIGIIAMTERGFTSFNAHRVPGEG